VKEGVMRIPLIIFSLAILGISNLAASQSNANSLKRSVFQRTKSDSAIKPFVFPKSMIVVRSCYPTGNDCLFMNPEPRFPGLDATAAKNQEIIAKVLDDGKSIKKYLVRLDPARIAPSKRGKDSKEAFISKRVLKKWGKQYKVDFIFVFSRTINNSSPRSIKTGGGIYIVRQDKVLVVPSNTQSIKLDTPNLIDHLNNINRIGLEKLAKDARKIILSHKFEKRRSNY